MSKPGHPSKASSLGLLTRESFSAQVRARDGDGCIACLAGVAISHAPCSPPPSGSLSAHHLLNRNLWTEADEFGGYFVDNGVTLCDPHHFDAEATRIPVEDLRAMAGITRVVLPRQLWSDASPEGQSLERFDTSSYRSSERYDTWGNAVLPSGTRLRGPLFANPACQKALAAGGALSAFLPYVKYPRTPHLPWSEGAMADDMVLSAASDTSVFSGRDVVVTEKLDGESSSLYTDFYHARSLASPSHPSQTRLKAFHAAIAHEIPPQWRVCVENCAAIHTIAYPDLESLFPVISIWDENNRCLSWSDTEEWARLLGMTTVPVLYRGPWDPATIQALYTPRRGEHDMEGYVVRLADSFPYSAFRSSVAKFVSGRFRSALKERDGVHWASAPVRWNSVRSGRKL